MPRSGLPRERDRLLPEVEDERALGVELLDVLRGLRGSVLRESDPAATCREPPRGAPSGPCLVARRELVRPIGLNV
jgi:hypothetical protein